MMDDEAVLKRMCGEFDLANMFTVNVSRRSMGSLVAIAQYCINVIYLDVSYNSLFRGGVMVEIGCQRHQHHHHHLPLRHH